MSSAIKLGSTAISNAKLGSTQVSKIYQGSNLIWQYSSGPNYVTGAKVIFDIGNPASYPGSGTTVYNLGSAGSITVGDVTIESSSGYFSIFDNDTGYPILTTQDNFLNGAVILGNENGKMTSVAKSATVTGSTTTGANSRGLRNMFTIQENYYNSSNFSSDATNGDVLLVYV